MFNDFNEDGTQDEGEDPLANVTVNLYCLNEEEEMVLIDTVLTDANGLYEFTQVQPSQCYISVTLEVDGNDNYVFSPVVDDGNQINQNGTSHVVKINYNENTDGWDVSMYLPLANIGPNLVFNDLDKDGLHDESEPALEGVAVSLSGWMSGSTFVGSSAVPSSTRYQNDRRDPTCIEDKNAAKAVAIGSGSVIILGRYEGGIRLVDW